MDQPTGPHHQVHIVLDQTDGEVALVDQLAQEVAELGRLLFGLTGGRFVEKQNFAAESSGREPLRRPGPGRWVVR